MKAKGANAPTGLELGSKEIKRVSNTKSLGVMVDEYLNWDEQFKVFRVRFVEDLLHPKIAE